MVALAAAVAAEPYKSSTLQTSNAYAIMSELDYVHACPYSWGMLSLVVVISNVCNPWQMLH